jgi:MFS family permease
MPERGLGMVSRLLVNQDFARLWFGQAISQVGDFAFDTTLVLWVGAVLLPGNRYAPAAVAGLLLGVSIATLLVGPLAGVYVDRWDRRATMLRADLLRAGLIGALSVVTFLPASLVPVPLTLAAIYAVVLLASTAAQFFNPARFALVGDVVTGDADRARASGISTATSALAGIVGPPLAAPLLFTAGLRWALIANALSFVVSFLMVRSIRVSGAPETAAAPTERSGVARELAAGLRLIFGSRLLVTLLVTAVVAQLGTGAINALGLFFVTENLHVEPKWYGTLDIGLGIGSISGALAAGFVAGRLGSRRVVWLGMLLTGAGIVVYARLTGIWPAIIVLGLIGVPLAALNTAWTPLLMGAAPREFLGRVMSVLSPSMQLASIVSVLVAGWLASTVMVSFQAEIAGLRFGRIDTIFLASGLLVIAAGVYAAWALREARGKAIGAAAGERPAP